MFTRTWLKNIWTGKTSSFIHLIIHQTKKETEERVLNETEQVYRLPMELKAEMKMKGIVPLSAIIAIVIMFFLAQRFEGAVYEPLKIPWYIYNVAVGFIMCIKTNRNGEKRLIQSILLFLTRDKNTYAPIDNPDDYKDMPISKEEAPFY